MTNILCYGDSNTWGYIPGTGKRYSCERRWPCILQQLLGRAFNVIEAGLNGRTTVFDDPGKAGRNGLVGLGPALESCPSLDWVILMLGTNDLKYHLGVSAVDTARGVGRLVEEIELRSEVLKQKMTQVLIVSPPGIDTSSLSPDPLFKGAAGKLREFPRLFAEVANIKACHFLDSARFVKPSPIDGVHLDAEGHAQLAAAMARVLIDATA